MAKAKKKTEESENSSLYRKYRPTDLEGVVGQSSAVNILWTKFSKGNIPQCLLFTGPSGCGKTTLARIVRGKLDCGKLDYNELNTADFRGIDMVRDIRAKLHLAPMGGKARVWLIDECHQLTKDAQNALLKMLEDTPSHAYFMLCTTEPNKLLPAVRNRCIEIKVKLLSEKELCLIMADVLTKECESGELPPDEVLEKAASLAEGSARKALQLIEAVLDLSSADEQMEALEKSSYKAKSIEICRALLDTRTDWNEMSKLLKEYDEDPEKTRWAVIGYMSSVLLGTHKRGHKRAFAVLQSFRDNFFDSGKAGLVTACYEVIVGG